MQLILNGLYWVFSNFFKLVGSLVAPEWVSNLILDISNYVIIANWYLPIDTMFIVTLSVIGISVVLMIVSILLQIL